MTDIADSRVTTVIITLDGGDTLTRTVRWHQTPVILIDNGSADGAAETAARENPHVELIRLASNVGAPARNLGVRLARTPYVAFADDDSWWAPGALDRAVAILDEHPDIAVVAARVLVGDDGRTDPLCAEMAESPLPERPDVPGRAIVGFTCFSVVVRRDAFLDAGGFDDVIFFNGEEERLALDLLAAGWDLVYAPDVVARHDPPQDRDRADRWRLGLRNQVLTATMRRSWPMVARNVWQAAREPQGRRALLTVVPRLPAALRGRRPVPPRVERRMAAVGK
ncbi:glycosyltransferase family 2 protein [Phytoactinopolyspora halotolerans]|uniref:Glycosyltransferase n=1 Tax=Phytoactinopolyspora halotolerans TaxID=1981512 RepID=A0A6L9SAA6_9ACTN|nr:glycosyltransferase [Phytoactinopolyspora halotolerans]NEE02315.1 glycosyltransferase [Phytoactinopolyspora halotolerans]